LYADKTPEGVARHENIQELLNGLKEFTEDTTIEFVDIGAETIENNGTTETTAETPLIEELSTTKIEDIIAGNGLLFSDEETLPDDRQPTVSTDVTDLPKLTMFMQDIALMTDTDKKTETEEDKNKVALMTIHAAKGLEFPYVYVVGLEENLFPSQMSLTDRADLEEERRLFYVAVTRAEKRVTLSYATTRYRWGNLIYCEPSRFIEEVDPQYLDMPVSNNDRMFGNENSEYTTSRPKVNVNKPKETFVQRPVIGKKLVKVNAASKNTSDFDTESLRDLQVGMLVQHERFGSGKVIAMDGDFPNNKATVFFEGVGQKQLLIKFAKLTVVA
jgi:DNA helicase-2/ATP-dependent DNA helicase PcrA